MNWYYSRMFKSQEAAREQNRREQRRLNLEIEEKRAGHRYNMETVRREQREIERELDKIRQVAHTNHVNVDVFSHHIRKSTRTHIINIVSPTKSHEHMIAYKGSQKGDDCREKQIDKDEISKALLYLENHPDALNQSMKQSDTQSDRMAAKYVAHKYRHAQKFVSSLPTKLQKICSNPSKLQPESGPEIKPAVTNVKVSNISESTQMHDNLIYSRNFKFHLRSSDGLTMYKTLTAMQTESHLSYNLDNILIYIPENRILIRPSPRLKYPDFKIRDQEYDTKTKQITEADDQILSQVLPTYKDTKSKGDVKQL
ncbi:hypothetical protein CHS0354_025676 [Potamilus streckersoni]|uniref:Uncharacterized protein n=1 Tax=Potamilus streckersoni TaxID=2493646 RepID=A0AAE0VK48_9BIVA|nr:hypothetical protein CHS0354_025676 [Potamilus streckersoni]